MRGRIGQTAPTLVLYSEREGRTAAAAAALFFYIYAKEKARRQRVPERQALLAARLCLCLCLCLWLRLTQLVVCESDVLLLDERVAVHGRGQEFVVVDLVIVP